MAFSYGRTMSSSFISFRRLRCWVVGARLDIAIFFRRNNVLVVHKLAAVTLLGSQSSLKFPFFYSEELHLVVHKVDREGNLMILPFGLFSPEERCPRRSILAGVFLYLLPFNKGIKRERWLTRRSTFRKKSEKSGWPGGQPSGKKEWEVVDQEVNLPGKKCERWLTRRSTFR